MLELDAWMEIAKLAAIEGGNYLLSNQGKDQEVLLSEGRDIKSVSYTHLTLPTNREV